MSAPIRHLHATLKGRPKAWARTGTIVDDEGQTRRVNPAVYRAWKSDAAEKLAAFARWRTFEGEVVVVIDVAGDEVAVAVATIDADDPRRKPTGLTGDIDNYAKAVLDALETAGVLDDDRQVAELVVRFHQ